MIRHLSHIGFTLGRTFIAIFQYLIEERCLLIPVGDATAAEVIRCQFNLNSVTRKNTDVVHPHLPADMGQHLVAVVEFYTERCAWQGLNNFPLHHNHIIFRLRQCLQLLLG
jgi:hypothetical protein